MNMDHASEQAKAELAAAEAMEKQLRIETPQDFAEPVQPDSPEDIRWAEEMAEAGGYDSVSDMLEKTGWASAGEMRAVTELSTEMEEAAETDQAKAEQLREQLLKQLSPEEETAYAEAPTEAYEPSQFAYETAPTEGRAVRALADTQPTERPTMAEMLEPLAEADEKETFPPLDERVARPPRQKKTSIPEAHKVEPEESIVGKVFEATYPTEEEIAARGVSRYEKKRIKYEEKAFEKLDSIKPESFPLPSDEQLESLDWTSIERAILSARERGESSEPIPVPEYFTTMVDLGVARDNARERGDVKMAEAFEKKRLEFRDYLNKHLSSELPEMYPAAKAEEKHLRPAEAEKPKMATAEVIWEPDEEEEKAPETKKEELDEEAEALELGYKDADEMRKVEKFMSEYRHFLQAAGTGIEPNTGAKLNEEEIESAKFMAGLRRKSLDRLLGIDRDVFRVTPEQEEQMMKVGTTKGQELLQQVRARSEKRAKTASATGSTAPGGGVSDLLNRIRARRDRQAVEVQAPEENIEDTTTEETGEKKANGA